MISTSRAKLKEGRNLNIVTVHQRVASVQQTLLLFCEFEKLQLNCLWGSCLTILCHIVRGLDADWIFNWRFKSLVALRIFTDNNNWLVELTTIGDSFDQPKTEAILALGRQRFNNNDSESLKRVENVDGIANF